MEVRRTLPVKLVVADSDEDALPDTLNKYNQIANETSDHCWNDDGYKQTAKYAVKDERFHDLKEEHDLTANLVQQAIFQTVEAVKSGVERVEKNEDTSQPDCRHCSVRQTRCYFHDDHVSLSTVDGPIQAATSFPTTRRTRRSKRISTARSGRFAPARSITNRLTTSSGSTSASNAARKTTATSPSTAQYLIDLGVENLAVASTGLFWTGNELDHWHREFQQRRGDLQQSGTQEAHRTLQRVSRKERAYYKHYLHIVANEIVEEAVEHDWSVIALEDFTDIRKRCRGATCHHRWRFNRLYEYVEYKAAEYGIEVEELEQGLQARMVPAYDTSQRCSSCGFTHEDNRPEQDTFECQKCGYQNHADYNAGKNVAVGCCRRLLRRNQTVGGGGAPVHDALNGGAMTVNV